MGHHRCGRRARRSGGQSTVEFLLVFMLFIAMVGYAFQWCYISVAQSLINTAAYNAARSIATAASIPDDFSGWDDAEAHAKEIADFYMGPLASGDDIGIYVTNFPDNYGEAFKVRVEARLRLLPLPFSTRFFKDSVNSQPTTQQIYSYSNSYPTRDNLVNASGQPFSIDANQFITVTGKQFYGYEWIKYEYTIVANYNHCHKHKTFYFAGSSARLHSDPWPNQYFSKTNNFPNEFDVPTAQQTAQQYGVDVPSHTSISIANMEPQNPRQGSSSDPSLFGPSIYKWTLELTTHGSPSNKSDGDFSIYAWVAMGAD